MRTNGITCTLALTALLLGCAESVRAQTSTRSNTSVSGNVIDTLGVSVAFAQVRVVGADRGITADEEGFFRLDSLAAVRTRFEVRRIGYDPVSFVLDLPPAVNVEIEVRMRPLVRILNTIAIEVRDPLRKVGFYDRMAVGQGHFITPETLAQMRPQRATDAFNNIPNVVVERRGARTRLLGANLRCEYALVVDNMLVGIPGSRVRTTNPDDAVSASDLYAIEVYPKNRGVPARFMGLSHEDGCGTVVIWTKGMLPR